MSQQNRPEPSTSETSLRVWVAAVLFGMNLLITIIGTVAILRYRRVAIKVFEDFDFELSAITQLTLSLPYAVLLPCFGLVGIAVRLISKNERVNLVCHSVHFLIVMMIAGLFVGTVVPTMSRLINDLS